MSDEYCCDNCANGREAIDDEIFYGTYHCKIRGYVDYVACCDDWEDGEIEPNHNNQYHDKKCEKHNK